MLYYTILYYTILYYTITGQRPITAVAKVFAASRLNSHATAAPHPSGSSNYACSHPGVRAKSGSSRPTHARSNACVRACRHVQMLLADMDACASRMNPQLENSCSPCVSLHFSSASLMDRTPNRSSDPGTCYRHAHSSHYSAAT
jgi:hypothetical protein